MKNIVICGDCLEWMATLPDGYADLAIVDPQTGQGEDGGKDRRGIVHKKKNWDNAPPPIEYFRELFRVSKNQIIWQAPYYLFANLPSGTGWICWDKKQDNSDYSDYELAWTSFKKGNKIYRLSKTGGVVFKGMFIHPCQKPPELYQWQLRDYAKPGWKIIDTHVGSGSLRIACHDMGFDFEGTELDPDYWQAQEERYRKCVENAQPSIFTPEEKQEIVIQNSLFNEKE